MELNILLGQLIPAIDMFLPHPKKLSFVDLFVDVDEDGDLPGSGHTRVSRSVEAGARMSRHRKEDHCRVNGGQQKRNSHQLI